MIVASFPFLTDKTKLGGNDRILISSTGLD